MEMRRPEEELHHNCIWTCLAHTKLLDCYKSSISLAIKLTIPSHLVNRILHEDPTMGAVNTWVGKLRMLYCRSSEIDRHTCCVSLRIPNHPIIIMMRPISQLCKDLGSLKHTSRPCCTLSLKHSPDVFTFCSMRMRMIWRKKRQKQNASKLKLRKALPTQTLAFRVVKTMRTMMKMIKTMLIHLSARYSKSSSSCIHLLYRNQRLLPR